MTNNRQKGLRMLVTKTAHPRSVRPRVGLRTWYLRFILSQFHLIWHDLSHSNEIKYECEVNIIWLARGMAYSQSRQTLMDIGTGLKGLVLRKFMNVMEHLGTCKCPGNFFFFFGKSPRIGHVFFDVCSGCLFPRTKHISTTTCLLTFVTLLSGSDNLTCHVWGSYQNAMRGRWQKYMAHRSQRHCRHTSPCLGFGSWWKGAT